MILGISVLSASMPTGNLRRRQGASFIDHCTVPNTVALTFDGGPYLYGTNISDALTNAGAKGTFFYSKPSRVVRYDNADGLDWDCIYNADAISHVKHVYSQSHGWFTYLESLTIKVSRYQVNHRWPNSKYRDGEIGAYVSKEMNSRGLQLIFIRGNISNYRCISSIHPTSYADPSNQALRGRH
ncbi:hypothetical protein M378DRAFT_165809 [Amanita muscaria Koide BX008]|uniref:NodB homology domain-containing protein n=1 Tax=Amanita muscaria (strain Koide BX008) TaxID=946122 RepID=A0A0C2WLI1_AMAMK|nr:hypothetical protein M378DRAFT_165809 [Amanita muscaria Koide BX008]